MKLDTEIEQALNNQISKEFYASHLYMQISYWFKSQNLNGFSCYTKKHSEEEKGHGLKICDYIDDMESMPIFDAIQAPARFSFANAVDAFTIIYAAEQDVTQSILSISQLSSDKNDKATRSFMDWYIDEQVQEESSAKDILDKLNVIGNDYAALLILDHELGG